MINRMENYTPNPANYKMKGSNLPALKPIEIRTDMGREEWDALADSKLQELLQTSSGALLLAVVRESKDRLEGKPLQRVAAAIKSEHTERVDIKDRDSLLDLARKVEFIMAKAKTLDVVSTPKLEAAKDGQISEVIDIAT